MAKLATNKGVLHGRPPSDWKARGSSMCRCHAAAKGSRKNGAASWRPRTHCHHSCRTILRCLPVVSCLRILFTHRLSTIQLLPKIGESIRTQVELIPSSVTHRLFHLTMSMATRGACIVVHINSCLTLHSKSHRGLTFGRLVLT